jgi:histidinol dehydrogenase
VDRLFMLGGAQAIAAMAYGTATVPQVDKIVGAGGLFTTLAKRQVYGQVGLDGLYGPTETVVVADDSANPAWVAADLLAQAEHDVLATAILLTPSRQLAEAVQAEVARQLLPPSLPQGEAEGERRSPSLPQGGAGGGLRSPSLPQKEAGGGLCPPSLPHEGTGAGLCPPSLPHEGTGAGLCPPSLPQGGVGGGLPLTRTDIITTSLSGQGGIVLTPDIETAVRLADEFAPEHLCLSVREPEMWAQHIHNAGGLFLGEHSFEVLGDYVAGPSHIMPTGGTAKWASPVNVLDFVKIVNVIGLDADTAARISPLAACIADAESLTAHAAAARSRGCRNRPTGRITCHRRKKVAYDQH